MLYFIKNENNLFYWDEYIISSDINNHLTINKIKHIYNKSTNKIKSYIEDQLVQSTNPESNIHTTDKTIKNQIEDFIKKTNLSKKVLKTFFASTIISTMAISNLNASQGLTQKPLNIQKSLSQKQALTQVSQHLLKSRNSIALKARNKALKFNKKRYPNVELDIEKFDNTKIQYAIKNEGPVINGYYNMEKNQIEIVIHKDLYFSLLTPKQIDSLNKLIENLIMHEAQHSANYNSGLPPTEVDAVDIQREMGHEVKDEDFPKFVSEINEKYLKKSASYQIGLIKEQVVQEYPEQSSLKYLKMQEMLDDFKENINSGISKLNTLSLFSSREKNDFSQYNPCEYLYSAISSYEYKNLTKDMDKFEKFVFTKSSAMISLGLPLSLASKGYDIEDIQKLTSIAITSQIGYDENLKIAASNKSTIFSSESKIEIMNEENSFYQNWLVKKIEIEQIEDPFIKDAMRYREEIGLSIEKKQVSIQEELTSTFDTKHYNYS